MPSEALNALLAKQQGDINTLLPTAAPAGSAKKSFHASKGGMGRTQPSTTAGGSVVESKNPNSDLHNSRAGVGAASTDRQREYEEKVLEGLAKRKEEKAIQMGRKPTATGNSNKRVGTTDPEQQAREEEEEFDPNNGKEVIERCFISIGGVKAFTSFQRLTPGEQECIECLAQCKSAIIANQTRDLHLNELTSCITGNEEDEEDEPIGPQAFSQYYFYNAYIRDLVFFPDKFDFLIRCIENSVVKVAKPSRFMLLMERIAARGRVDVLPDPVVNYERLLDEDEERRLESFTLKKDWVCKVPHYLEGVGATDEGLPPVTTVHGTWNHKDTTVDRVREANATPTPSEDDRAREEEERRQQELIDDYVTKNRPGGVTKEEGRPTIEALAIISDPNYQWKRIRVPKTRPTDDDKEHKISSYEFSSNRRAAAKQHAKTYPSHDGSVRLPAEGEWTLDHEADGLYYCAEFELFYDHISGQYYDAAAECWYFEELGGWFAVGK